jgi:chaperonin GroEL
VISPEVGLTLEKARPEHLGRARRVVVDKESTTIVGGAGDAARIRDRIEALKKERKDLTSDYDREKLDERIAKLSGGVAVIKVGAATETELKERKLRVEDALHATRAAVEEGIVPGGGVALLRARRALAGLSLPTLDEDSGLKIVARALEEPLRRIVLNAAQEPATVLERVDGAADANFGYDAARRSYGDMLEMGVIDPAKVTRLALQNAGSIASLILTIDCLVAEAPKKEAAPEAGAAARAEMY